MIDLSVLSYINLESFSNIVGNIEMHVAGFYKQSLEIPNEQSEDLKRTDNTMSKRKSTKGQTLINKTYT